MNSDYQSDSICPSLPPQPCFLAAVVCVTLHLGDPTPTQTQKITPWSWKFKSCTMTVEKDKTSPYFLLTAEGSYLPAEESEMIMKFFKNTKLGALLPLKNKKNRKIAESIFFNFFKIQSSANFSPWVSEVSVTNQLLRLSTPLSLFFSYFPLKGYHTSCWVFCNKAAKKKKLREYKEIFFHIFAPCYKSLSGQWWF